MAWCKYCGDYEDSYFYTCSVCKRNFCEHCEMEHDEECDKEIKVEGGGYENGKN